MPTVHVNVWEGFGEERVKTVIQNITKVFVDLGVPAHAVEVIVHEIPKTHWGIGGVPCMHVLLMKFPYSLTSLFFDTQTLLTKPTTIVIHKQIGDRKDGQSTMHQM